ncbi:SAM-dependent methyltransferase [Rhodomicrobium udaipurense JA643]|nr:SAM-dependent methyltransferase [Rhodomicrobium udaipurense JA643]
MFLRRMLMCVLAISILPQIAFANAPGSAAKWSSRQYTFSKNWFDSRIPSWTRLLEEFKGKPGINYLEIGAFEGRSALWVLENILTHPTSKITVIDAFEEKGIFQRFSSNITLSGEADRFRVLVGPSTEKLKELPSNSFDLAFIDGSGKGVSMLADLVGVWNLVKLDGIIICSRYPLDDKLRRDLKLKPNDPGPYEAIDAFLKVHKNYTSVLSFQEDQIILRKTRE